MVFERIDFLRSVAADFFGQSVQAPARQCIVKMEPPKRALPSFGAEPGAFGEDWADYHVAQVNGPAVSPQRLEPEMKEYEQDPEKPLRINTAVPSMPTHGHVLNLDRGTDQLPIRRFDGETSEAWDGQIRNVAQRHDFQGARGKSEPTIGDLHAIDLKTKYPYDFSF